MRIHTKTVWDLETGIVLEDCSFLYDGPIERLDRALAQQATDAANTASGAAATYGAGAQGIQADLVPTLERDITNAPGYDPIGLGQMETAAQQSGAAASGSAAEGMRLRALRSGNMAGVGSGEVAAAGETARATGGALQQILAKNAELKAKQRGSALTGLQGILGEDIRGQAAQSGLVPEDIKTAGAMKQVDPWAGDFAQINDVLGLAGKVAGGVAGGMGGGGVAGGLKGFAGA